jgi:hypothetical protein
MTSSLRRAGALVAAIAGAAAGGAGAHPVTVDGSATDWWSRGAIADNLGIIARDATGGGEYIWRDAAGDARTDIASPETEADITRFQVTADTTSLYFLVRTVSAPSTAIQVQIAIDLDRTAGSGQVWFAGFSDTQVNNSARWEYLVRTRFASGGTAEVLDAALNPVTVVSAARGADGIEIAVPWSALGLSATPSAPLRFTVASFRTDASDMTLDILGTSNALDVVTDYGDPRTSSYPNTWSEVSDGIIDYYVDVYFNAQGEVYSPLLIQAFVSNSPGGSAGEWISIRNVSPMTQNLGACKLGDEETPDATGPEGMYTFPAGATLAPGGTYVVAQFGSNYFSKFGRNPDAEFDSTTSAPDMVKFLAWATGAWGLANAGDEILLLDPSNTAIDIVTYGSSTYLSPGLNHHAAAPAADEVHTRSAAGGDTDDCEADFAGIALSIDDVQVIEGNSGTVNAVFNVTLLSPSHLTVTVNYATADGTATEGVDYAAATGQLTFLPGVTTQTVTVTVYGDTLEESDETFTVSLSGASNAAISRGTGTATILDDEVQLNIGDAVVVEGNAGTVDAVFTVTLSRALSRPVSVQYATADGTATTSDNDYVGIPLTTLTFLPGVTSRTLTVTVNGDTKGEPNERFTVVLSNPVGASIGDGSGLGTITNDDTRTLTLHLVAGYNLVALPFEPQTPYTAESLAVEMNAAGIGVTRVLMYNGTGYDVHTVGSGTGFAIDVGVGYFIRCTVGGSWDAHGAP